MFEKIFDVALTRTPCCIDLMSFFTIFFPDNLVEKLQRGLYQLSVNS
ncbi:hypothetical protein GXM_09342 [Nostoc sphaeroides CCNUC1]|uniref:Uncharacterized protein n=1 Tax=Nostoc sphaeroides CCNUC1 TaxID=2653204 RepID=A0A5P8WGE7_9NOSO|nr:hypothetical protein GXM_09342 [Nostoc sphaeroides CCNUC1]